MSTRVEQLTVGIDLASQAKGTAACWVRWSRGGACIEGVETGVDDARLTAILSNRVDKIGIDVPLGWPDDFVASVARHHGGEPFRDEDPQRLVRRATDRWVRENTMQLPLSVSTDRIAYPAMRAARIIGRLSAQPIDRGGGGTIVEAYPAAALRVWNLQHQGYKRDKGRDVLAAIIGELRRRCTWMSADDAMWRRVARTDDALDALICALIARACTQGRCHPIPQDLRGAARREGWIAVPLGGSLEGLAT